ncbi:MAG: tRNA (adenosine(37)-N6)-threonylcarbamoyltransferase complex ATPase subunit type 1 TsaE [Gemmatimonadaceae bacterium]|nr:tRNA (adenosine(37)-N6)-threonylcarbamoyltransferase complex ATPase subunit type 1 TsaE [Gemmatimonadaceae bacterium]
MPRAELDESALRAWGEAYGAMLRAPAVVALSGDLGAGKTTLTQAIAAGLGVTEDVTSPTYALVHEYGSARGTVWHLDLYRLRDAGQLAQLGWDDILASGDVVLIEWPERAADALPADARALRLEHVQGRVDVRSLSWTD